MTIQEDRRQLNCANCGATNHLQTGTCWRCGQPFVAASKEGEGAPVLEAPASQVEQAPQAPDPPAEAVAVAFFGEGDTEETEHAEPTRAEPVIEAEQPHLAPIPEAPTVKCRYCGTGLHPAAQVCWKCGSETPNYTYEVRAWYEHQAREREEREQEAARVDSMIENTPEIRGGVWKKSAATDAVVIAIILGLFLGYSYVKSWPCSPCFALALLGLLIIFKLALDPPKGGGDNSGGSARDVLSDTDRYGGDEGFINRRS